MNDISVLAPANPARFLDKLNKKRQENLKGIFLHFGSEGSAPNWVAVAEHFL